MLKDKIQEKKTRWPNEKKEEITDQKERKKISS